MQLIGGAKGWNGRDSVAILGRMKAGDRCDHDPVKCHAIKINGPGVVSGALLHEGGSQP